MVFIDFHEKASFCEVKWQLANSTSFASRVQGTYLQATCCLQVLLEGEGQSKNLTNSILFICFHEKTSFCKVVKCRAGQGRAGQGRARQGQVRAGQGRDKQGRASHGRAGPDQGRPRHHRARHGKARAGQAMTRAGQGRAR